MEKAGKRILLLLDMNGTLCYRSKHQVIGVRKDTYAAKKNVYARPGLRNFIRELSESGNFVVCIYTSMMRHNVFKGLDAMLKDDASRIERVFDRSMNKQDPQGKDAWDTMRDTRKVWQSSPGYGAQNTILVDNEYRKFRETPKNGLVIAECDEAELQSRSTAALDSMLSYLIAIGDASPEDVRDYISENPYKAPTIAEDQPKTATETEETAVDKSDTAGEKTETTSKQPKPASIDDLTKLAAKLSL